MNMRKLMGRLIVFVWLAGLVTVQAADFSSWGKKMPIQFSGYTRSEPLTNFPVLVVFSNGIATGFSYADFLSANADLRFTDDTQTNELNYEVERWDTNGSSVVWVQVPLLTNNASIFAIWGKSGQTAPDYTSNGATWSNGYAAVWHLHDTADNTWARDATAFGRNATNLGTAGNTTGFIADGESFSNAATSAFSLTAGLGNLSVTGVTISTWVKLRSSGNYPMMLTYNGTANDFRFNAGTRRLEFTSASLTADAGDAIPTNEWHHVAATFDDPSDTSRLFIDGRLVKSSTSAANHMPSSGTAYLGRRSDSYYLDGLLDEMRVSSIARSSNWVWACYLNQASNSVFGQGGQVQSRQPIIMNNLPSGVTSGAANLNGTLSTTGQAPVVAVAVYWGPNDGGTVAANWSNSASFTPPPQAAGPLTTNITGLAAGTLYYYRFYATNAHGDAWADSPGTFFTGDITVQATTPHAFETPPGNGVFTLYRPAGSTQAALTVFYALAGSASNGVDYTTLTGQATFSVGSTNTTVAVAPIADGTAEGHETVMLTLTDGGVPGTPSNATVTMADSRSNTWTGNGNSNNDGNWNVIANWNSGGAPDTTNDVAVLPAGTGVGNSGTSTRTLTIDSETVVGEIALNHSATYKSAFTLGADLSVGRFTGLVYGNGAQFPMALGSRTLTIGTNNLTTGFLPVFASGSGVIRKVGTGAMTLVGNSNFAGTYEVREGTFATSWTILSASSIVDVYGGASYQPYNAGLTPTLRLRGNGVSGAGALRIPSDASYVKNSGALELVEDAAIGVDVGTTVFKVTVVISGPGTLHKVGAGTLEFNGTTGYGTRLPVAVDAGTFLVSGLISNLVVTVNSGATNRVTGNLLASDILVKSNGVLTAPFYRISTNVVVEPGGIWNSNGPPEWIRGPTGNDDGNWSEGANWGTGYVPTQTNVLPQVTDNGNSGNNIRTITVDQTATSRVVQVGWNSSYFNKLRLGADFTVDRFEGVAYNNNARVPVDVNGRTFTVGIDNGSMPSPNICPEINGTGLMRKVGTGSVLMQGQPFTGTYQIDGGIVSTSYGTWPASATVLVNSGGTWQPGGSGVEPAFILNGTGGGGIGALRLAGQNWTKSSGAITVPSAASIYIESGRTFSYGSYLRGAGPLTVFGGGTMILTATTGSTNPVAIVLEAGLLQITGTQSNLLITIKSGARVEVTGFLRDSAVTVKSNGLFTCPAANVSTNVTVEPGGTWDGAPQAGWAAGGNNNNDGVWSNPGNWGEGYVPTNVAIFRSVNANGNDGTVVRTATNDLVHTVVEIQMTQDANGFINAIHVATNLTVGRFTGMGYGDFNSYRVTIGPGAELAVGKVDTNAFSTSYLPEVYGSGTLRKRGDQMVTLRGAPSFTGSLLVEEGTLSINWATLNTATHLVVSSGAVCSIGGAGIQPRMTLNGSGLAGTGALRILDNNHTRSTRTTIASDSVMSIGTSYKLTHNGPLDGGGVMTLLGGGTLDLNGVWTFSSTNGPGNGISVRDGVVDIAGCTLTFTNLASTMAGEYVVIDYNWPNGSVVGEFVATNGLNARWRLARTGTKTYTNAVVLAFVPPSGSNFIVR